MVQGFDEAVHMRDRPRLARVVLDLRMFSQAALKDLASAFQQAELTRHANLDAFQNVGAPPHMHRLQRRHADADGQAQ